VETLPGSTVFHSAGWLRVLHDTYGHKPVCFCQFEGGRLQTALVLMEVSSVLKGRRGVSLPFTDVCPVLRRTGASAGGLYEAAVEHGRSGKWKSLECRGEIDMWKGASVSLSFFEHVADLSQGPEALFNGFESAMRRGIRKAEKQGLSIEFSPSAEAVREYYGLHCLTRRRHGLPPQPVRFFENIQRHILEAGHGFVALVKSGVKPLAGGVFFCRGGRAIYKFGASDESAQHLRPNNLMMWSAMKRCQELGAQTLSFGRTSVGNEGLRRFKLSFGAAERAVEYAKYDFARDAFVRDVDRAEGWFNRVFRAMPGPLLRLTGDLLYPHLS
jgi:hypothetical protein